MAGGAVLFPRRAAQSVCVSGWEMEHDDAGRAGGRGKPAVRCAAERARVQFERDASGVLSCAGACVFLSYIFSRKKRVPGAGAGGDGCGGFLLDSCSELLLYSWL